MAEHSAAANTGLALQASDLDPPWAPLLAALMADQAPSVGPRLGIKGRHLGLGSETRNKVSQGHVVKTVAVFCKHSLIIRRVAGSG